jgi:hypothetical protein
MNTQDDGWEACREVWLDRLDPWGQATVSEAAKKRGDRRARQSTDGATGATTAKRASVEQPETALQRRLRFFQMVGLWTLCGAGLCSYLPAPAECVSKTFGPLGVLW